MGGNAFNQLLPPGAFPRIPPAVYEAVKARLLAPLESLYERVGVPFEAPEKTDYGDLDFLVVGPRKSAPGNNVLDGEVGHEDVKNALGATIHIGLAGNRTSNFAVPVGKGEWDVLGHGVEEARHRSASGGDLYYQVDVHVCADDAEWERIFFYHSYGDLGMILGLVARNNCMALGTKGLRIPDPPNPPFHLTGSFPTILKFFGLSFETWTLRFTTKLQAFEWVATSRFFDATSFRAEGEGIHTVKIDRKMYAEFVQWVGGERQRREALGIAQESHLRRGRIEMINEALVFFNKREEFEELVRLRLLRARIKQAFNGHKVNEWAGLAQHWKAVKLVMDRMRERLGGDEGVLEFGELHGEEALKKIALEVRDELGVMKSS